jgi:hypothetical protein
MQRWQQKGREKLLTKEMVVGCWVVEGLQLSTGMVQTLESCPERFPDTD